MTEGRFSIIRIEGAVTQIVSPAEGEVQGWNHFDKADMFPVAPTVALQIKRRNEPARIATSQA